MKAAAGRPFELVVPEIIHSNKDTGKAVEGLPNPVVAIADIVPPHQADHLVSREGDLPALEVVVSRELHHCDVDLFIQRYG